MSFVSTAAVRNVTIAPRSIDLSTSLSSSLVSSSSTSTTSRRGRRTQRVMKTTSLLNKRSKKSSPRIARVRTNAMLLIAIDSDRIATVYDSSSESLRRTMNGGIERMRVFEVADGATATMPMMNAPDVQMGTSMSAGEQLTQTGQTSTTTTTKEDDTNNKEPVKEKKSALQKDGWLGPITNALESTLQGIDGILAPIAGSNSYGYSILVLTLLVKIVTFPLTKTQIEGSVNMQALQPKVKELQAMYANDAERLQMETARLYKEANFNPLAGCLPVFATLPVFIGLYRALSNASIEGLLADGFYWIPSLGGPATIEMRNEGSGFSWLFPLVDGAPPIGWHDALSYLVLPVLLVISQFVSQKIMQPESAKSADPAQQQSQAILKFLPLMIGYFSLNVPAGLTLYWFFNNIVTTAQTVYLRKTTKPIVSVSSAGSGASDSVASSQPVRVEYVPKRERRSGATIPRAAAPKVDVSNAISAEFGDFDDGPAKVTEKKSAVESEFGDFEHGPAKVEGNDDSAAGSRGGNRKSGGNTGNNRKNRRGSR